MITSLLKLLQLLPKGISKGTGVQRLDMNETIRPWKPALRVRRDISDSLLAAG